VRIAENVLLWTAVGLYFVATLLALVGAIFRRPGAERWGLRLGAVGGVAHLGSGIVRWVEAGHAPVQGVYENSLAGAFVIMAVYFVAVWRIDAVRRALPAVLVAVLLLIGNGLTASSQTLPLEPPYKSGWLVVHVSFAWVAFGSYLVAAFLGGMYLVRARRQLDEAGRKRLGLLDDATGRLILFGFVADTVMIASGALWAHGLWGRYWGWDPIETWSLISWLIYGANLHLRFTLGWNGRKAAWLAVLSVVGILVTFFGVQFVSDVHTELL